MSANSTMLHVRIDEELKQDATEILEKFHLTISDAVRMLMKRVVVEKSLPIALLADKETYEVWFQAQLVEAMKKPIVETPYEDLVASYRAKYKI